MTYINCESWPEVEKTKNKDIVSFTNRVFNDNCVDECDTVDDIVYDKDVEFLHEEGHEIDYDYDIDFETSDSEENYPLSENKEESFKDNNESIDTVGAKLKETMLFFAIAPSLDSLKLC